LRTGIKSILIQDLISINIFYELETIQVPSCFSYVICFSGVILTRWLPLNWAPMPCKKDLLMAFSHTPHPNVSSLWDYLISFKNLLEGIDLTSESSTALQLCISKIASMSSYFTFLLGAVFPMETNFFKRSYMMTSCMQIILNCFVSVFSSISDNAILL
jgi:hypothetical protein